MINPTVIDRARAFLLKLWQSEPVRTILAPLILAAVVASLVKAGVDGSIAGIVATVVLGALGFTAQEIARAKVTPSAKVADAVAAKAIATVSTAAENLDASLAPETRKAVAAIAAQVEAYAGKHRCQS